MRNWNQGYLDFAKANALRQKNDPIILAVYSDIVQQFRLAAKGQRPGRVPPEHLKKRIIEFFDPLPFWYPPLEDAVTNLDEFSINAITQRPMAMYHSWDSQNAWLRQIHSHNYLFINAATAIDHGIEDGAWIWVESQWGKVRCMARHTQAVELGTVWTWNAIGKAESAWHLDPNADESKKGFLLNHLITEELPIKTMNGTFRVSNSDPITGQAGWYDVRVKLSPAGSSEDMDTWPTAQANEVPGMLFSSSYVNKSSNE
jgi:anaerobic selenocysteine-containing dehydrogenase